VRRKKGEEADEDGEKERAEKAQKFVVLSLFLFVSICFYGAIEGIYTLSQGYRWLSFKSARTPSVVKLFSF
jgi:hypothetical protein